MKTGSVSSGYTGYAYSSDEETSSYNAESFQSSSPGVSESLCVRHSMSTWSMNATQEENRSPYGQCGAAAIL
ncbi:hypothetical protein ACQUJV_09125, partial [Ralstonia pseudosolanacearum]